MLTLNFEQGFNALSNLEYIYEFPHNWGELLFCLLVMVSTGKLSRSKALRVTAILFLEKTKCTSAALMFSILNQTLNYVNR